MLDILEQNYVLLVEIRNYLVKKGQARYKGNVISTKLEQAKSAFESCCNTFLLLEKSKDIKLASAIELYEKIKQKYEEIVKLCILPVTTDLGKMDFDLKVACSLIPVMDGVEATTKRLIDSVEMYAGMLDAPGKTLLITFVLKSRLSENAKLRMSGSYKTIQELIDDLKKYLLPKKSFMAIQMQLQNVQQGSRSIEDYGSEVEKLFTELTITQADGKADTFSVLKPINESFAIKRFSDGLRSSKLSTIISARGFNNLKDAIQAAKDEECTSFQPSDSELEELGEQLPRYRPDSIAALRRATRFTEPELKRLYRGFKAECPTGVVKEETFKLIYSQFFPQGAQVQGEALSRFAGKKIANTAQYAHFVFNTLDQDRSGLLSFEEFVTGLSILSRGTLEEKLRWTFSLYDINGDGCITKEEMTEIVTAIYDLMGKIVEPMLEDDVIREKVERLFQKMDLNRDGVLTLDEFLDCCLRDEDISRSMGVFDSNF